MHEELITELNSETDQSTDKLYDLINMTRNIMLRNPGNPITPPETKKPLESGWKLAKEFQDADDYFGGLAEVVVEGLEPDQQTIEAIESLGEAVLDEAFECLGDAALEVVDAFNKNPDKTTRLILTDWLWRRIQQIKRKAEHTFNEEDDETFHYSATRLSPKLIGTFPDIKMKPTCLSGSILAMSFFNKTDLPMLHGNISHSATQEHVRAQNAAIDSILRANYKGEIELDDQKQQLLLDAKKNNDKEFRHRGFHAVGYVQIDEDSWVQLDPNSGDAEIRSDASALNEIYAALCEQKVRGYSEGILERKISEGIFEDLQAIMLDRLPDKKEITEIFENTPAEELGGEILRKVLKPYMPFLEDEQDPENPENNTIKSIIHDIVFAHRFGDIDSEANMMYMQAAMDSVIEQYIFHVEDSNELYEAYQRCKSDQEHKERRIADAQLAPLFLALKLHSDWEYSITKHLGTGKLGHIKAEVGLAPYRVGISVLSDMATYLGDELPLSTWLTYWPSLVSYAEHQSQSELSVAQATLAKLAIEGAYAEGRPVDDEIFEILEQVSKESNWL